MTQQPETAGTAKKPEVSKFEAFRAAAVGMAMQEMIMAHKEELLERAVNIMEKHGLALTETERAEILQYFKTMQQEENKQQEK